MWKVCNNKMLSSLAEVYDLINILKKYVYYSPKKAWKKKEQLSRWNHFPHSKVKCIYSLFLCSAPICTIYRWYIHKCSLQMWRTHGFNFWIHHTHTKNVVFLLNLATAAGQFASMFSFFPSSFKASPKRLQHTFMYNYHVTWKMLENVVKRSEFVYARE